MGHLRVVAEGTYTDHDAVTDFVGRATTYVKENHPGTLAWECYLDEPNGTLTMFEEFTDEGAFAEYEEGAARVGLRDEAMKVLELKGVVVMGEVRSPEILGALLEMGATMLDHEGGFTRSAS